MPIPSLSVRPVPLIATILRTHAGFRGDQLHDLLAAAHIVAEQGQRLVGWRKVPVDADRADLGDLLGAGDGLGELVELGDDLARSEVFQAQSRA